MTAAPARRSRRGLRTATAVAGVAVITLLAIAGPVGADPPGPTEYRSTIDAVTPEVEGVEVEILGGDSFLELRVDEGIEVLVPGYSADGAPYLRFRADGTVERNTRSEATYLNEDRLGGVDLPAEADDSAEPVWEEVADGGSYAWHDHRIHWMASSRPPGVEPGDVVQTWTVPVTVDGEAVEITGRLVLVDRVSPLPWIALAAVAAAAVAIAGRRRPLVPPVAVAVAALGATVVGGAEHLDAPAGSGANPLVIVVPLIGLVAAVVGVAYRRRVAGPTATLAAAAAVIGWGLLRIDVLWMPILPTPLPANLDRAVTAVAIGLATAAAAVVVWSGSLSFAHVGSDPEVEPPGTSGEDESDAPEPGTDPVGTDGTSGAVAPDAAPGSADAAATRGGGEPR